MGIQLKRKKKRHLLLSFIYRLDKFIWIKDRSKLKFYLDLEWIFNRLSHEYSFRIYSYENHPNRVFSRDFMFANITSTDEVLDLGCKYGDLTKILSKKAKGVVGIDYDSKAIGLAQEKYKDIKNVKFICAEAYAYIEKREERFDVLILSHVLEHIDSPLDFLKKFSPHFKRIYIEVPDFEMSYLNHYRKKLNNKLVYTDNDHVYEFDRSEIRELLHASNLTIDMEEYRFGVQKIWCSYAGG